MKTWVLLLLGCMLAATSHAQTRREVYEWKDANGVTHYSDYPQPGARKITLSGAPTSAAATPTPTPKASSRPAAAPQAQYDALEIISPDDEASYFEPDVEIVVRVRPQPALAAEDRLVTYLDGKQLGDLNQLEHRVQGLPRGAHTLQSAIFGRDGQEKVRSEKVTIFMKLPTATNPRNQGPALRPQPKPTPK